MGKEVQNSIGISEALEPLVQQLYETSGAVKFALASEEFSSTLETIAKKYLPASCGEQEIRELYLSLRVEELVLARACAAGNECAWETFLLRYREKLYDVATYIAKESSAARELADSVYAELYGMTTRDGQRVCKLSSYTGRGSLEGWLRTVVAQEHVNRYRKQRRLVSLDEESEDGAQFAASETQPTTAVDARLEAAVDEALAALPAEDRFVLASYYLDDQTLAEIARTLKVHESTISRKLDKLAKSLRKQIMASLMRRAMSRRQAQEALETDVRDLNLNLRSRLMQESAQQPFSKKEVEGA